MVRAALSAVALPVGLVAGMLTLGACAVPHDSRPPETEPRPRAAEASRVEAATAESAAIEEPAEAPADPDPLPPVDPELDQLVRGYYADFGQRDWPAFAARFWPGATVVTIRRPQGGGPEAVVATDIEEFLAEMQGQNADPTQIEYQIAPPVFESDGVVALARVSYVAHKSAPSEAQTWRGVEAFLLVRHADQWRIASLAFGSPRLDQ